MRLESLWLTDFRSYEQAELTLDGGLTAVVGRNGAGKTNLLEAVGYLATLGSIRGAPTEAMIRDGAAQAIVRGRGSRDGRELLVEAEINRVGRNRAQLNRQPLRRARDLLGALRVTVFAPDDLTLVKGGPAERRRYLDDALVATDPTLDVLRSELERILRQRNALLRQSGGRLTDEVATTLDVWDARFAAAGDSLAAHRSRLVEVLAPVLADAYARLAPERGAAGIAYAPAWATEGLAAALAAGRHDDLRRGASQVGPHRDELDLTLDGRSTRTHASQGEQRTMALALRLAAHHVVTEAVGAPPILLLDDVFSELDPVRSAALVANLPEGQTLLTTAGQLPEGMVAGTTVTVADGRATPG